MACMFHDLMIIRINTRIQPGKVLILQDKPPSWMTHLSALVRVQLLIIARRIASAFCTRKEYECSKERRPDSQIARNSGVRISSSGDFVCESSIVLPRLDLNVDDNTGVES